jgi:hypothetical protein
MSLQQKNVWVRHWRPTGQRPESTWSQHPSMPEAILAWFEGLFRITFTVTHGPHQQIMVVSPGGDSYYPFQLYDLKLFATILFDSAMSQIGMANLATAAAEQRSQKHRPPRKANPGGDELIRRSQRGERPGSDPKIEAWRRGIPVPPDQFDDRHSSRSSQAIWWAPGGREFWHETLKHAPDSRRAPWVSVTSWTVDHANVNGPTRIYEVHMGGGRVARHEDFDYGEPRWDTPSVQALVFESYQDMLLRSGIYDQSR